MAIAENVANLRERITAAARRAGRNPDEIALMGVTKQVAPAVIREAYAAGIRRFGENRVQEFAAKRPALGDLREAQWRLIGHLQTNKTAAALELFAAVDSVDSLRLAEKLDTVAQSLGKRLPVLLEINLGGEASKTGFPPSSAEFERLLEAAPRLEHLRIEGLMTVPPFSDDPAGSRPYFRKLRRLRDQTIARRLPGVGMDELSMGMSHDFEVAVEEGSTCVRVGTAIFGARMRKMR